MREEDIAISVLKVKESIKATGLRSSCVNIVSSCRSKSSQIVSDAILKSMIPKKLHLTFIYIVEVSSEIVRYISLEGSLCQGDVGNFKTFASTIDIAFALYRQTTFTEDVDNYECYCTHLQTCAVIMRWPTRAFRDHISNRKRGARDRYQKALLYEISSWVIYRNYKGYHNSAGEHWFSSVVDGSLTFQHIPTAHVDGFIPLNDIDNEEIYILQEILN